MANKVKVKQLYFGDDYTFQFIDRVLEYSCILEKAGDKITRAWKHFYSNTFAFSGYKSISAGQVTLGYARDIILDLFNKVPIGDKISDKPDIKAGDGIKNWIARIAENMRHTYRTKPKSTFKDDVINWALIGIDLLLVIGWLIGFAMR
jgi:hypothetical protein